MLKSSLECRRREGKDRRNESEICETPLGCESESEKDDSGKQRTAKKEKREIILLV